MTITPCALIEEVRAHIDRQMAALLAAHAALQGRG
jgi:hypothetical protein